jgi:hypothetical protein
MLPGMPRTGRARGEARRRGPLSDAALRALFAFGVLCAAGCGGGAGIHTGLLAGDSPDTIKVIVAGKRVVVPAPEGMADVIRSSHIRPSRRPSGDILEAIFEPRERIAGIQRGAKPKDLHIYLILPAGNSASDARNASGFEDMRSNYLRRGEHLNDPEARRIAEALEYRRAGVPKALENPMAGHQGDTIVVAYASPNPRGVMYLAVGRARAAQGGEITIHSGAYVLVNGRVVELWWWRNGPFTLQALDDVDQSMTKWIAAVQQANP